jgi:hypothetical protein
MPPNIRSLHSAPEELLAIECNVVGYAAWLLRPQALRRFGRDDAFKFRLPVD